MLEFGRMNRLTIDEVGEEGARLKVGRELALLAGHEVTKEMRPGDMLDVFVYADTSGQAVATLKQPLAVAGEFALLRVCQVNVHGAFMAWGLSKDLLVPFKEQNEPMKLGQYSIVKVCLDRDGRPIGKARIEKELLAGDETLQAGQEVDLLVWQFTELGGKVIINNRFGGLLYHDEIGDRLKYGDRVRGYIRQLRADGKIDCALSLGNKSDRDDAKQAILAALADNQGFLPLHDKSAPEQIQARLGMSKKIFKKAVGGLYRTELIELAADGIRLKNNIQ